MQPNLQPMLRGAGVFLRPLTEQDFDACHAAACDPEIWAQHPDRERHRADVFRQHFFSSAVTSQSAFVIVESSSGRIIGSTRFYDWDPAGRSIAIGYTFFERAHWGLRTNGEVKRLMLEHAFSFSDAVWFHVAEKNLRSRRAVEKLGARLVGREPRVLGQTEYLVLFYQLTTRDWQTR
ncbi:GNAT family N-acetyltransferase [uncultured Abyssibacter sp.]|uniref:GNAT family N-acetyltransferase n=1 Tax=uncultured Abyssibacter sp. TaxID=2320202 RepID=UPI0032B1BA2B